MGPELCSATPRVLGDVEDLLSVSATSKVAQVPVSLMLSNHYCQVYGIQAMLEVMLFPCPGQEYLVGL